MEGERVDILTRDDRNALFRERKTRLRVLPGVKTCSQCTVSGRLPPTPLDGCIKKILWFWLDLRYLRWKFVSHESEARGGHALADSTSYLRTRIRTISYPCLIKMSDTTYDLFFTGKDDPRSCVIIGEDTKPVYFCFETPEPGLVSSIRTTVRS